MGGIRREPTLIPVNASALPLALSLAGNQFATSRVLAGKEWCLKNPKDETKGD